MKRTVIAVVTAAAGIASLIGVQAVVSASPPTPLERPPAVEDSSVPTIAPDLGLGERLLLVVEGVYATREEAEAADAGFHFGDVQGFYVAQVANFDGLRQVLPGQGGWALLSAFRTSEGAEQFAQLAEAAGAKVVITPRVTGLGGTYAGLGQEPAPDGSGPLSQPVPASEPMKP